MRFRQVALGFAALATLTGAAPGKVFGPADIGTLGRLADKDKAAFENDVEAVAKFTGAGTVAQTDSADNNFIVDTGKTGDVSCFTSVEDIKLGDKVTISGVIRDAASAATKAFMAKSAPPPPGQPAPRLTDEIMLIAGTCRVTKL